MTDPIEHWLQMLDERHLGNLTPAEVARALRALSSCYVERRGKLKMGGALDSAGKRAAFALFYGPLHFLVVREVVRAMRTRVNAVREITDLGCGTGAAGAAWGIESGARITGFDRHPWAVEEANRTYRDLRLRGRASKGDVAHVRLRGDPRVGILAAYTVNELAADIRTTLLETLLDAHARGAVVMIVEPIARRMAPWWAAWQRAFEQACGSADEWRFPADLPPRQRALARAAGLNPRELTARTLVM